MYWILSIFCFVVGILIGDYLGRRVWYVVGKRMSVALITLYIADQVKNKGNISVDQILPEGFDVARHNAFVKDDLKLIHDLEELCGVKMPLKTV